MEPIVANTIVDTTSYDIFMCEDVLQLIISFIDPTDAVSLSYVSKYFEKNVKYDPRAAELFWIPGLTEWYRKNEDVYSGSPFKIADYLAYHRCYDTLAFILDSGLYAYDELTYMFAASDTNCTRSLYELQERGCPHDDRAGLTAADFDNPKALSFILVQGCCDHVFEDVDISVYSEEVRSVITYYQIQGQYDTDLYFEYDVDQYAREIAWRASSQARCCVPYDSAEEEQQDEF